MTDKGKRKKKKKSFIRGMDVHCRTWNRMLYASAKLFKCFYFILLNARQIIFMSNSQLIFICRVSDTPNLLNPPKTD